MTVLSNRNAARAKGASESETGLLLMGLATGLMWMRTLNFVLVQQDLGQASAFVCVCGGF